MTFNFYLPPITNLNPSKTLNLIEAYNMIKDNYPLKFKTYQFRKLTDKSSKSDYKKSNLPYVTFSGRFEGRKDNNMTEYSSLICIDIDGITIEQLQELKVFCKADSYTALAFTSPNFGFKIVIRNDNIETHEKVFNAYREYVSKQLNIALSKFDSSGKNLSRACFLCHDEEAYINPVVLSGAIESMSVIDYRLYDNSNPSCPTIDSNSDNSNRIEFKNLQTSYSLNFENKNSELNFRKIVSIVESKNGQYQSPREPWIQKLACLCNTFGMSEESTMKYCLQYFADHPESIRADKPIDIQSYIVNPIIDSYKRYKDDFSTWEENDKEERYITPTIPNSVFENCPTFLKSLISLYDNSREKDTIFLATLCVLSNCFPEVFGIYDQKYVNANLFLFITAPASAGKGSIAAVRYLGHRIQEKHDEFYNTLVQAYDEEMEEYQQGDKKGKAPLKPKRKVFFIPANNSSSKILDQLSINKNFGMIMDTEADTLSQALKTDWGNFSDIIRKAFHHEALEMQRKIGDEYISMQRTSLSILLTGTPNQVNTLIKSIENGAFSRFIFYDFPMTPEWKDVFKESGNPLPEIAFKDMGRTLFQFSERIKSVPKIAELDSDFAIEFKMTKEQKEAFNNFFAGKKTMLDKIYGDNILPSLHRLGLVGFRIAMILSILDQMEASTLPNNLICQDRHFILMLDLVDCLLHHTAKIYSSLINSKKSSSKVGKRQKYFDSLSQEFTWMQAKEVAALLTMTEKQAEYSIKKFKEDGIIVRLEYGSYSKL